MTNAETNDKADTTAEQGAARRAVEASLEESSQQDEACAQGQAKRQGRRGQERSQSPKGPEAERRRWTADQQEGRGDRDDETRRVLPLAEIVEATGWQKHTVRGFVSILGSKGRGKIESSKNAAGERRYRIAK
jgi:Protein of unknown function (DUF3489)